MKKTRNLVRSLLLWLARPLLRHMARHSSQQSAAAASPKPSAAAQPSTAPEPQQPAAPEAQASATKADERTQAPQSATDPRSQTRRARCTMASLRSNTILFNEQFLNAHYELRYNTMKQATELRPAGQPLAPWQPLTERVLNRITVEQLKAGGQSWGYGMKLYVDSDCIGDFNPVQHYLDSCPAWDGRDHIGALARRVPTDFKQWPQLFHRWLLAWVAQARGMSRSHGNSVIPMLIGEQGTHKSTFCKMLVPDELREYYLDDIKMDNAEQAERVLARMWLVCIDEYDSKTQREQAKIKRLLTERDVQVRRMRSEQYALVQRMASFIATTNDRQPLCDPTGSRRYLCVELSGCIDTTTPLDHRQLFAQALHELAQGAPYYLTRSEEQQVEQHNKPYTVVSATQMLLSAFYQPAARSKEHFVRAVDMLQQLQEHAHGSDRPNMKQLGMALKAAGFHHGAYSGVRGWYARRVGEQG